MSLPVPPVPPEADLRPLSFMPLHVQKLRDSDLAAECEPEACWYAVLLWCASWHQLPAGSLPDNDTVLCKLIGLGRDLKTWRTHREQAMRGWYKCSDGRLYHPVVAQEARNSWNARVEQFWRTECARIKKANQRNGTDFPTPSLEDFKAGREPVKPELSQGTLPLVPEDTAECPEGQGPLSPGKTPPRDTEGTGKGQGQGINNNDEGAAPPPPDVAEEGNRNDLVNLAARCARAGGVNLTPAYPKPFARELDIVRDWQLAGIGEELILSVIEQTLERSDESSIGSLKFFDGRIRKAHALAERKAGRGTTKPSKPPAPKLPIRERDDDDPRLAKVREQLKASANGTYATWLAPEHTAFTIRGDILLLRTRSRFYSDYIDANLRPSLERVAGAVDCSVVRVEPI